MIDREDLIRFHDPDYMFEIGDDCDGVGMLEIRYIEKKETKGRVTFNFEQAKAIGQALIELADKKLAQEKTK